MKRIFTIFLLFPILTLAQSPIYDNLDVNNINARFYSAGMLFSDTSQSLSSYEYPKGSGHTTIYAGGLWMGGLDINGQLHLAGQMFGQGKDYYPGPVSNPSVYSTSHVEYNYVWKVTKAEIDEFILWYDCGQTPGCTQNSSYVIPDVIINWPGTGENWNGQSQYIAPFIDVNQNGIYNPLDGDYPCIKGDMALFTVFNDDAVHTETGGERLKMEIRALHYGYNSSDSALANTIFSEYTIINYTTTTYFDFYIGIWEDMDIGCSEDDYVGCDVERNLAYTFNADSVDNDGCNGALNYGYNPAAQGMVILRGPSQDNDGVANQIGIGQNEVINGCGYGDNIPDNERLGMGVFAYFDRLLTGTIFGAPILPMDFYNYMQGIWMDGTHFTYGGTGNGGALDANYLFPDASDAYYFGTNGVAVSPWSELSEATVKGDRRLLASMGTFTFTPFEVKQFTIAHISALDYVDSSITASLDLLKSYTDDIHDFYACDTSGMYGMCDGQIVSVNNPNSGEINDVLLYPNPTSNKLNFKSDSQIEMIKVYNLLGKVILSKEGKRMSQIDISELPKGIYLVEFEFKSAEKSVKRIVKE
jgi:hypothetical protein